MEVMEDGNLMDKVHILIQRDMEYYTSKQSVLQEMICRGIVGGRLDFPRSASFAAMKLVLWWEEEYIAAYRKSSGFLQKPDAVTESVEGSGGCGGVVKASDPTKFVQLISKCAEQFLEHLHVLTQEALDHADLTVLTGTIGAAALLKNCLWFYIQCINDPKSAHVQQLQVGHKKYQEMGEALAERLLDLHCRLLSLYILQDADSLNWECNKPFCESERGSYIIQMWWLYMQGDSYMSLSYLIRISKSTISKIIYEVCQGIATGLKDYLKSIPSEARSPLLVVDISNLLLSTAQLLPAICDKAEEYLGCSLNNKSKILRDVHTKCQELLICLILRGAPLDTLYKIFRKGIKNLELFSSKNMGPCPWIMFSLPNVFKEYPKNVTKISDLPENNAIYMELAVLLAQPQPNWALLLKVIGMKNCKVLQNILQLSLNQYTYELQRPFVKCENCGGFLCSEDGNCKDVDMSSPVFTPAHYYDLIASATDIILCIGNETDLTDILIPLVTKQSNWAKCFDRRNVWNQIRPPWYEAILDLVKPMLPTVVETVINAVKTGASMYQAMSIILACFSQFWDCSNPALLTISSLLQDLIPVEVIPLHRSVILQIIISALYTELLKKSIETKKVVKFSENLDTASQSESLQKEPVPVSSHKDSICSFDGTVSTDDAIALAVAESLCCIDEDNKHTDQINDLLEQVGENSELFSSVTEGSTRVEKNDQLIECLVSDLLMTSHGKKSLKTMYHFIKNNSEWLFQNLGVSEASSEFIPNRVLSTPNPLLHTMFHIGYRPFDQLLTGEWQPNWTSLLQTAMGLSLERVWTQLSMRWEFRDINSTSLSTHDVHIVNNLTSLLKQT